jgi:hypothetical protein
MTAAQVDRVAALLRAAFETQDLSSFGGLLADDVWWGDDDRPPRCRGRSDVLATFNRLVGQAVETTVTDIAVGPFGLVAVMQARWADTRETRTETALFHAYLVRGGLITQISRYETLDPALEAIGA